MDIRKQKHTISKKLGISLIILVQLLAFLVLLFSGFLPDWLTTPNLMIHKMCYMLHPVVIWLHVVSDVLIAVCYYTIPTAILLYVMHKNTELRNFLWLCILFVSMCGTVHLFNIVVLFKPLHLVAGLLKAGTAIVSIITAFTCWSIFSKATDIPAKDELKQVQEALIIKMNEGTITRNQLLNTIAKLEGALEQKDAEIVKNKAFTNELEHYIDKQDK